MDPLSQALIDWDTYYNHEPFWGPMRDLDLVADTASAGFGDAGASAMIVSTNRILQSGQERRTGELWLLVGQR